MNRSFYSALIFVLAVSMAANVLQGTLQLLLRKQIIELPSMLPWVLVQLFVSVTGAFLILWYYWYKRFRVTFYCGLVATIATLLQLLVSLYVVSYKQLPSFYIPVVVYMLIAGLTYGGALAFTRSGTQQWLRTAGFLGIALNLATGGTLLYSMSLQDINAQLKVQDIIIWIGLFGNVIPLIFILNFNDELKVIRENDSGAQRIPDGVASVVPLLCLVAVLIAGTMLTNEGFGIIRWNKGLALRVAEWEKEFDLRTISKVNEGFLKFQISKPRDFDPDKTYPMVVCLPYGEGIGGAPVAQWLLSDVNREKYPAFLFVPYAEAGHGWGGVPVYTNVDTAVFEAIEFLLAEFPQIDPSRIYVSGISLGGYGTWHFMSLRPDLFAAGIPVCGGGNPQLAPRLATAGVWAFHGAQDINVPVQLSRDMITEIKKAGGDPRYTEFPNRAHGIWDDVMQTPGVLDWLFDQKLPQVPFPGTSLPKNDTRTE